MTFKTFEISGFRVFAYKFFLTPTTSEKDSNNIIACHLITYPRSVIAIGLDIIG
jgi:hypothetical protein